MKDLQSNKGNSQIKLVTFAEISRTVLGCSSCSFILPLFLNQGKDSWYEVILQLKMVIENDYLDFHKRPGCDIWLKKQKIVEEIFQQIKD